MDNENWQIPHIEKVLAYHNKSNGTDLVLIGKCKQIFPTLKHSKRWDWVCEDKSRNVKAAIEVKRLTDERKHEEYSILRRIARELEGQLSHGLRGTYRLLLTTGDRPLNLGNDNEKLGKVDEFRKILQKVIEDAASDMKLQELLDMSDNLRTCLPDIMPPDFYVELRKVKNEGARLAIDIMPSIDAPSSALRDQEFVKFKTLVQKANTQLYQAKIRKLSETFLVLLDLLYFLAADSDAIKDTFYRLEPQDHCNIDHVYYVDSSITRIKP